uniref:Transposase/IS protein n=1 Tax=Klebsiella pneumoniae TaxID=573 RepID=A0A2P1BNA8_KLEPN|nr:transposase/IS protein [Klebsiella pneumoniae]
MGRRVCRRYHPDSRDADRLLHHAHILTLSGESYRLKDKRKAEWSGKFQTRMIRGSVLLW